MRGFRSTVCIIFGISLLGYGVTTYTWTKQKDVEGPVITMEQETLTVSIEDNLKTWLEGISAHDDQDGDVTDSLIIENISKFSDDKVRQVSIVAMDSSYNVTRVKRNIKYTDYHAPKVTLKTPLRIPVGTDIKEVQKYFEVEDCIDGQILYRMQQYYIEEDEIDTAVAGFYPMGFSVRNNAGDTTKFVATIEVYNKEEKNKPSIELKDTIVYLEKGEKFKPKDYIKKVIVNEREYINTKEQKLVNFDVESDEYNKFDFDLLDIKNPVNTQKPGWYEVEYTVKDIYKNERKVFQLVCVEEE